MCDTMDWDLISEQVVSHVEECLPRDIPLPTNLSDEVTSPAEVGPLAAEDSTLRTFEHRSSFETSGRTNSLDVEQHRRQAAKNGGMRAQRSATGRNVNEVLHVMRRIELVEEHVSDQDNDFAHYRIVSSRAEGAMAALQRRQAQLDTDVCELRDMLATTDRRCLKAESALHEVVGQAQVINAVRAIIDPLRDQVQARLSNLENDASDLRNLLGHRSTRELSSELEARMSAALSAEIQRSQARHTQVKEWIATTTDRERKRHESEAATLREEVDQLSREVKSGQRLSHRAETKAKELESTVRSFEKRLTVGEAELTAGIRKAVEDSENDLRRRIQEVRATDLRRIDDICSDLGREKHSRLQERAEVAQEITDVRGSLLRTEQHWQGRTHELLNRLEVSMANTANDHSRTRCSINSISSQLKQLQLEVQGVNDRFMNECAQRISTGRRKEQPEGRAIGGHQVLLTQPRASLPQASCSETSWITPKAAFESSNSARTPAAGWEEIEKGLPPGSGDQEVKQIETRGCTSQASAQTAPSCRDSPPPGACPISAKQDHVFRTPATVKLKGIDRRLRSGEGDDKPDAPEVPVQSPSEGEGEASSSVGHSGDFVSGLTGEDEDQGPTLGNVDATRASPSRDNGEEGLRVARANSLRKSALAAASLSVDEEEEEPSFKGAGKAGARQVGNQSPASCFSSSSPSRPLAGEPSPSPRLLPENSDLLPGATAVSSTPPGAPVVTSAEIEKSRSIYKPGADGFGSDASGGIGLGVDDRRDGSRPPPVTHSTERDSDSTSSSFSEDEGAAREAAARPGRAGPVSEQWHVDGSLWQQKNESSPFVSPKPNSSVSTPSKLKDGFRAGADSPGDEGAEDAPRTNRREGAPPPPPPRLDRAESRKKSATTGCTAGPAPISLRARSASKESGMVTAQCEFCLRRYLKAAMAMHLQTCELRLVRCPYQCGTKVLVRNLDGHKKSCSMKLSAELQDGVDSTDTRVPTSSTPMTSRTPPPDETTGNESKTAEDEKSRTGKREALAIGPGDAGRTVTCMRCHESLPFLLVPSHGPKCKGNKVDNGEGAPRTSPQTPAAADEGPSESRGSPSAAAENRSSLSTSSPISATPRVTMARPSLLATGGMIPPSLSSSPGAVGSTAKGFPVRSEFSPRSPSASPKSWHAESRIGTVLPPGVRVPPSPPRSKNVRSWGTRQVTSWLREVMRPPRADIISRFHERGVVGTTLLSMTNRYLMEHNDGMGITDAGVRAQILEAIVSLED